MYSYIGDNHLVKFYNTRKHSIVTLSSSFKCGIFAVVSPNLVALYLATPLPEGDVARPPLLQQ